METKQQVSEQDYEFLWRLSSLQHALVVAAANPVGIWRIKDGGDTEFNPPGMYHDCVENDAKAIYTMKKRIKLASNDIKKHFQLHGNCLDCFLEMDGAIITDNRETFADFCKRACNHSRAYMELVKKHKKKLKEEEFLFYPSCPPGHYFHILNHNEIARCSFNENRTYDGAIKGVNTIHQQIINFKIRENRLPYIHLPMSEQDGAGFVNLDLKTTLITTKLLLERVGLSV